MDALSQIRCNLLARQLVYWSSRQTSRERNGMYVSPLHPAWIKIEPWVNWQCKIVDESVLKKCCLLLLPRMHGTGLWQFKPWDVAQVLQFLTWEEQSLLLEILEKWYA